MHFFKLLGTGLKNYWRGIQFLIRHRLYWFVIFPVVLFLLIFNVGQYFEDMEWSIRHDLNQRITEIDTINGLIWKTVKIIFYDALYYLFTKFTMYLVIMCLAPVLTILSEKVEKIITGNTYKWNFMQVVKDIKRAVRLNLRLLLIEYLILIILIGLGSLIGGITQSIFIYIIPLIIGAYFYGFGYIDYVNERRRLNISQSIHFVSRHKGLAVALGGIYSACFLSFNYFYLKMESIPSDTNTQLLWGTVLVVTFLLAAIAPIAAVTSSTLSMHEIVDLSKNEYATPPEKKATV
ncbi:MAG: EI24 domain-containing protein [Crocinitomicaceae bacterium]